MRRTIALTITAVLALALAPVGVAQAQVEDPRVTVTINQPANGSTVIDTVQFDVNIRTNEVPSHSIHQWVVEITGSKTHQVCAQTYSPPAIGGPNPVHQVNLRFRWDTHRISTGDVDLACETTQNPVLTGALSSNGSYRVNVYASTFGNDVRGPVKDEKAVNLGVSNAPVTPTGVGLKHREATGKITMSWNANPEPDVRDYLVQECKVDRSSKPCESWKTVDDVSGTSLTVTRTKPAVYRYRVIALRPAADGSTMTSGAAAPQSDPTEIHVEEDDPAPTPNETAGEPEEEQPPPEPEIRTVERPTRRVQRAAPRVLQRIVGEDPGFSDELPYEDDDSEEAIGGLPGSRDGGDGDGQRAVLIPLAGGTLLLVFALQVHYLNRRASRTLEPVPAEALDGGWDE